MSHVYCPECGFQNPEAANYCSRCGSLLHKGEAGEQTMTYTPEEVADDPAAALHDLGGQGPGARRPLRRRQGGGELLPVRRAHADRPLARVRRVPRRRHRLAPARGARARAARRFTISDLGSLNGTFVNKKRIESAELEDDDELQIGKYRLTFLRR